jgi:hypothetical protein
MSSRPPAPWLSVAPRPLHSPEMDAFPELTARQPWAFDMPRVAVAPYLGLRFDSPLATRPIMPSWTTRPS